MMSKFYNNMKTFLLLSLLSVLVMWIGVMIGGRQGLIVGFAIVAVMNFVSYFFSDKIAIMSMRGEQVGPDHELYRIVEDLARRGNLPMPRVYVSPQEAPNAFATGRSPKHAAVCATQGLLSMLDRNEIAGVMAHELAHVRHRDILITTVAATIAAAISQIAYMQLWFGGSSRDRNGEGGGHPALALLALIVGPLAAGLIQAAISRSREFNADKAGAEICGDPMYLATALEKIHAYSQQIPLAVNPAYNSMFIAEPFNPLAGVGNLFQTHPPLEQRIENLIGRPSTGRFVQGPKQRQAASGWW